MLKVISYWELNMCGIDIIIDKLLEETEISHKLIFTYKIKQFIIKEWTETNEKKLAC